MRKQPVRTLPVYTLCLTIFVITGGFGCVFTDETNSSEPVSHEGETIAAMLGQTQSSWSSPQPSGATERKQERERMVRTQIAQALLGRDPVSDEAVLRAMQTAPRHRFVPEYLQDKAYSDTPLPIGKGQTISQPYMVAAMTELLELTPESRVLEIGTGSGYQAAVLAHLTPHVYSVEIIKALAEQAVATLRRQGYGDIRIRNADGYFGWPEAAPFDAIIVTCAAGHLPPPLWEQLKPGGRIVIPVGGAYAVQRLIVMEKAEDGSRSSRTVMAVRFVPMTGKAQE